MSVSVADGSTDNRTIDEMLATNHTTFANLLGARWFFRQLFATSPVPGWIWAIASLIVGLCTPLEIWAAGNAISDISTEASIGASAHPWRWTSLFIGLLILERVLEPWIGWAETLVRQRAVTKIHADLLEHTTVIELAALEYQAFYDTTRRTVEELPETTRLLVANMGQVMKSVPSVFGTAFILSMVDWRFVAALLIPLIPSVVSFLRAGISLWHLLSDQTRDRRIATYIASQMTSRPAAREIRLFGLKSFLLERFSFHYLNTRDELRKKEFWLTIRLQLVSGSGELVSLAAYIWIAISLKSELGAADIAILMTSMMAFRPYDLQMAAMAVGKQGALASDIQRFLALPAPAMATTTYIPGSGGTRQSPGIDVEHLTYAYPGTTVPVVDGVSLSIPAGQRVALVGENGAGKTTLLKLILGLYKPDAGTIRIGERELATILIAERQRLMAAVFQHFAKFPVSWAENIALDDTANTDRLAMVTAMSGSDATLRALKDGDETILSPDLGGVDLSGGQWQRLAIARAGFRDAAILALDEPTAALDPHAEVDIFQRFIELSEGRTTLLVSHRLGMCRLADRILVLEGGRLIEDGTHDELVTQGGRYAELWEMQARWYR